MITNTNLSDKDLLYNLEGEHSSSAVAIIYQRYSHLILGTCLFYLKDGTLAQDAAMDIFEYLLNNISKYKIVKLKPWLLQVTRNHCLKELSRVINKENKILNRNLDINSVEIAQERDLNNEEVFVNLENALKSLKEHQQKCIVLFYLKGKSYQEISSETGYDVKKVKSYIQNGKLNLSKQLLGHNDSSK